MDDDLGRQPGTALAPGTDTAPTPRTPSTAPARPAPAPNPPAPAAPAPAPVPATPAPVPAARPAPGTGMVVRPGSAMVPASLAQHSKLDQLRADMTTLNTALERMRDKLSFYQRTADALDQVITNMDELGKFYEAPLQTRDALDADSALTTAITEMVAAAQQRAFNAQLFNAQAFQGLDVMAQVQDNQRAMGAGPRLLQTAGR